MGFTHFSGIDAEVLAIDGTTVTLTAAEMNALHDLGLAGAGGFFDVSIAVAAINTDNGVSNLVVPAITGKQFFPTFAAMVAAGSVTTATVISLTEETTDGVVLSHVAADMASGVWAGPTGGTVVTTKLNTALTVSEGIKIVATGNLTVTTAIRVIVAGYYL